MSANPDFPRPHPTADSRYVGCVRESGDWSAGAHPMTVCHCPTRTIFELMVRPGKKPDEPLAFEDFSARLVHVCMGAPWPSGEELSRLCAEAVIVRLHQRGLVTLVDDEGGEGAADDDAVPF